MNTEVLWTWYAGIKLFMAALIGFCYSRAGRGWKPFGLKFRRRVYLPLIYCLTMVLSMFVMDRFSWWLLGAIAGTWGVYYATMSIFAYGANSWIRKLFGLRTQQFIVGFIHGGSCILIVLAVAPRPWGIYILSCVIPSIVLGVLGGLFPSDAVGGAKAAAKEALTGVLIFLFALFLI